MRFVRSLRGTFLCATIAFTACGNDAAKDPPNTESERDGGSNDHANGDGNGNENSSNGDFGADASTDDDGCSEEAQDIYLVTDNVNVDGNPDDPKLLRFRPATSTLTTAHTLPCLLESSWLGPRLFGSGFALDRHGVGWLNVVDLQGADLDDAVKNGTEAFFKIDIQSGACTKLDSIPIRPERIARDSNGVSHLFTFPIAFSRTGNDEEVLYGTLPDSDIAKPLRLASLDAVTNTVHPIAEFSPAQTGSLGLMGTNGQLLGYKAAGAAGEAVRIYSVDPATAKLTELVTFPNPPTTFPLAFWGGDYWGVKYDDGAIVRFDTKTKTASVVTQPTGKRVIGMTSSTCAPRNPIN